MIKQSIVILFSLLLTTATAIAATPTASEQTRSTDYYIFKAIGEREYFRLQDICRTQKICQCLQSNNQKLEMALGDYYPKVKSICNQAPK